MYTFSQKVEKKTVWDPFPPVLLSVFLNLARGRSVWAVETYKIGLLAAIGNSNYSLAVALKQSASVVCIFRSDSSKYVSGCYTGRLRLRTDLQMQSAEYLISQQALYCASMKRNSCLSAFRQTIWRALVLKKRFGHLRLQNTWTLPKNTVWTAWDSVLATCIGRTGGSRWFFQMKRSLIWMNLMGSNLTGKTSGIDRSLFW